MFSTGFKEGAGGEIHIKGTSSAAFKALLKYIYTDDMEVDDDPVLFELAKLSDQYRVERLHNHCLHRLFKGITVHNAVMRLVQAHTTSGEGAMWVNQLRSTTMSYVTHNFGEIQRNAMATLVFLACEHPRLYEQVLGTKGGYIE
jgi:hypothetical protein